MRRVGQTIAVALLLAGCAAYPKSSAVSEFADATTTATNLLQDAGKVELLLAEKSGYEQSVTRYIIKQPYAFPPNPFALLDKKIIATRIALLKAIGEYAKAIGELNDPELSKKVGDAVGKIASSAGSLAEAVDPQGNRAFLKPAIGIISSGSRYYVAQRNAIAIRSTADAVHGLLEDAAELLIEDFKVLNERFGRRLTGWRALHKQKMAYIRNDPKITRVELEKRFQEFYEADRELTARVAALLVSGKILQGLVKAHDDLRKSEDTDRAIREFKDFVDAIALNVQELKKIGDRTT